MLVLSRRVGESLVLGDGLVTLTVLKVIGSQVRLGITAPREVRVHRGEVHKRIQEQQALAGEGETC